MEAEGQAHGVAEGATGPLTLRPGHSCQTRAPTRRKGEPGPWWLTDDHSSVGSTSLMSMTSSGRHAIS